MLFVFGNLGRRGGHKWGSLKKDSVWFASVQMIIIQMVLYCKHAEVCINSCGNECRRLNVLNSACPLLSDNICVILLWEKWNKDVEFALILFELLLAVVTVHAITPSWLAPSLSLSQVKSLLDYIFWLHKMRLRGTLDICAWPAFQRWLSEQKWQVNCWFLFRKRERASLPWAL